MSHENASYAQSRFHRYRTNNNSIERSVKLTNQDVVETNEKTGSKHETGDNVNIKQTNLDPDGTISFRKHDEAKRDLFSRLVSSKNDVLYTKHVFDNMHTLSSDELDKLNIRMLDHHDKLMSDVKHSQKILDQIVKEQLTRYRNANSKANY